MAEQFNYRSVLAPYMNRLISIKESAGMYPISLKWYLKEIDAYVISIGLTEARITREIIDGWRKTRVTDSEQTLYSKYSAWSQLARLMTRAGCACYIPVMPKRPSRESSPYIFTHAQISAIFEAADKQRLHHIFMGDSMMCIPAMIRLLYSTGMRISEVLTLKNEDVHLQKGYISIHKTKNRCERLVALSESMKKTLIKYMLYRDRIPIGGISAPKSRLFVKPDGTAIHPNTAYYQFKKLLEACGIPHHGNHKGPRVHDLRHTSAVHALVNITRAGQDVHVWLPVLSASLGHNRLETTEQYVRLTRAMYAELGERCATINETVFPKITIPDENND